MNIGNIGPNKLGNERREGEADFGEDTRPVAGRFLPEEAHGGVPRAVGAIEEPAPVGDEGEGEPDGDAQSAGEMGDRRVRGDDEVEVFHDGGGVHEGAVDRVDAGTRIEDWQAYAD